MTKAYVVGQCGTRISLGDTWYLCEGTLIEQERSHAESGNTVYKYVLVCSGCGKETPLSVRETVGVLP